MSASSRFFCSATRILTAIDFFSLSSRYQYPALKRPKTTSTAATCSIGEPPPPPLSNDGMLTAAPFLPLFGFGAPSRLIRIIACQNSSGPNPRPLLTDRHSVPPVPLPAHPRAPALSGTD